MKFLNLITFILIVFFKTGNVLSNENIFNVNNIELLKKANISNNKLANKAIKLGFEELTKKILLQNDYKKLSQLNFQEIKQLVSYYQIIDKKRIRPKKSEVDRLLSKNSKAKKLLKWKPKYVGRKGFYRALKITINWFKNPKNLNLYKSDIYNV